MRWQSWWARILVVVGEVLVVVVVGEEGDCCVRGDARLASC